MSLKQILTIFEMNTTQIANEIGVSRCTVYDWIKGRNKIPVKRLVQLSEYFDIKEECFSRDLTKNEQLELELKHIQRKLGMSDLNELVKEVKKVVSEESNTEKAARTQ